MGVVGIAALGLAAGTTGRGTSSSGWRCSASGVGFAFAAMVALIIENVRPTETGVATGMNMVMRMIGD